VAQRTLACSRPGCPHLRPCPEHERRPDQRPSAATRGYGREHRVARLIVLARDPVCVICQGRPATVADHHPKSRRDLVAADLDPDDPQHMRGLCKRCHDGFTASCTPGGWNRSG
jgi:5-methylcytosine-specific restriction enzyme A